MLKWLLKYNVRHKEKIIIIIKLILTLWALQKKANSRSFGADTLHILAETIRSYPTNVLYQIAFPCFVFWYLVCLFRFWKIALFWEAPFVLSLLPINKKKQTCMYCAQNNMLLINVLNFFKHLFFWWQAIVFAYIYYAY